MKSSKRVLAVAKLLDLCDDLQRLRSQMSDPALRRETRNRLRQQSRRKAETLARDLRAYRFRGPLGSIIREFKLSAEEFQLLSVLLQHHLRAEEPAVEGRLLLGSVFGSSFEVLSAMELLAEDAALRASGLVTVEECEECPESVLEMRFRLSAMALEALRQEADGAVPEDQRRRRRQEGYKNSRELLLDLRILHNLYQMRAERVFHGDRWDRVHAGGPAPGRAITKRIESFWSRVRAKLDATPQAGALPAVRFMREYGLDEAEMIIVVHLLFKELYEGNPYDDAAYLLRLVSADELELIRNRRLVRPGGSLVRGEILQLEAMIEGRELTSEAHLSDWVVDYLFGGSAAEHRIEPDERLDWHLYLQGLEDTQTFFRDLEAN